MYGIPKLAKVTFLDSTAPVDWHFGPELTQSFDPALQPSVSAWDSANFVVDIGRPVDRDDHVIYRCSNDVGTFFKRQTRSKKSNAHAFGAAHVRQGRYVGMHQRLAAGEYDPFHVELAKAGQVRLEIARGDFSNLPDAPDIAHHTAAVAAVVREDYQDRKACDPVIHADNSFPASRMLPDKLLRAVCSKRRTGARTRRSVPPMRIHSIPFRAILDQR